MHDLRYLHELDRSIVSVIKDYAHQNNFPEFNELLIDLKSIEKNTEKGYSDNKIKNSELSTMIDNQDKLRINLIKQGIDPWGTTEFDYWTSSFDFDFEPGSGYNNYRVWKYDYSQNRMEGIYSATTNKAICIRYFSDE